MRLSALLFVTFYFAKHLFFVFPVYFASHTRPKIQNMATSCSKSLQDKGRRRVSLSFAILALFAAVRVSLVGGREARKFFFFEKASAISFQPLSDSPTCSSTWVTMDSTTEAVYEKEAYQLLVDIKEVQSDKIGSEENLSMYMIDFVNSLDLSVSVHRCHSDELLGVVSCLGALRNGHISIHAWPSAGKVLLDIFARGSTLDAENVKDAKSFLKDFPEPLGFLPGSAVASNVRWTLKARGESRPWETALSDLDSDLQDSETGMTRVASVKSVWQSIDIYDTMESTRQKNYELAMLQDREYTLEHPELFLPDRVLFLDGVEQSYRHGNAAYHESLVQPALFTHKNPKRVAIIGGGECATLREALKHNTVEKVVMIEIDQVMMDTARTFLPEWNDCSDLEGSNGSCIDDPRAEIYAEDAFKWFADRYLNPDSGEEPFDVIIMDALDPQNVVEFAGALYGDNTFLGSLYNALGPDGILISQMGEAPSISNPSDTHSWDKNSNTFVDTLFKLGIESAVEYTESHCGFESPWTFFVSFKSAKSQERWFSSEAQVNLEMQKRSTRRKDGELPFDYFDGATMVSYQPTSKATATVFCRRDPVPDGCDRVYGYNHGFDPERENVPAPSFNVTKSLVGENAGRGVFALVDIPANSYIGLKEQVNPIVFEASTYPLIEKMENSSLFEHYYSGSLYAFMHGYGYHTKSRGVSRVLLDSGMMTFQNHGCNNTNNVGLRSPFNESNADPKDPLVLDFIQDMWSDAGADRAGADRSDIYNPAQLRDVTGEVDVRNHEPIMKGEELLDNYITFITDVKMLEEELKALKTECGGGISGIVSEYESFPRPSPEAPKSKPPHREHWSTILLKYAAQTFPRSTKK